MGYGHAFRHEVHNESITPLIGIFDMYSASLAAQHYGRMFVSDFGFRNFVLPAARYWVHRLTVHVVTYRAADPAVQLPEP